MAKKNDEGKMKLQPLGDRVVIRREVSSDKTAGGIYLPDTAKDKPQRGEVLAVGEGRLKDDGTPIPMGISVGDTIIYGKFGGTEVKVDGEEYMILRADDVYAIVG
jgi:chaperonin GroES